MAEEKKKGIVEKIIEDMKEDARQQHKIDKENFEAVKKQSKELYEEAKKEDPDFAEFKEAKGLKEKAKVVGRHAVRNGKQIREEQRETYEVMLKEQRENI